jgi:hypothetical protein
MTTLTLIALATLFSSAEAREVRFPNTTDHNQVLDHGHTSQLGPATKAAVKSSKAWKAAEEQVTTRKLDLKNARDHRDQARQAVRHARGTDATAIDRARAERDAAGAGVRFHRSAKWASKANIRSKFSQAETRWTALEVVRVDALDDDQYNPKRFARQHERHELRAQRKTATTDARIAIAQSKQDDYQAARSQLLIADR